MSEELDVDRVAGALMISVGLLRRRLRQVRVDGELTLPETAALSRLDRGGSTTSADLARQEQISPQSMGTTLSGLEARGLVQRQPDQHDGRRILLSLTETGRQVVHEKRTARAEQIAKALSTGFTKAELHQLLAVAPLIERLAEKL
ncbi:MAG TPA: MarR family transcriptional regulator [Pseudonocardiaceae bacterium]|jgi:DNA-binding MarR family transcriptional regulator|nr:MarR family transcriptional regulator [Pseudonocardiaceae bacterium]